MYILNYIYFIHLYLTLDIWPGSSITFIFFITKHAFAFSNYVAWLPSLLLPIGNHSQECDLPTIKFDWKTHWLNIGFSFHVFIHAFVWPLTFKCDWLKKRKLIENKEKISARPLSFISSTSELPFSSYIRIYLYLTIYDQVQWPKCPVHTVPCVASGFFLRYRGFLHYWGVRFLPPSFGCTAIIQRGRQRADYHGVLTF